MKTHTLHKSGKIKAKTEKSLCDEYGISRPTGDRWIKRYLNGESLLDYSKSPNNVPNKTSADIENQIVEYRKRYPALGAVKLHRMLNDEGIED